MASTTAERLIRVIEGVDTRSDATLRDVANALIELQTNEDAEMLHALHIVMTNWGMRAKPNSPREQQEEIALANLDFAARIADAIRDGCMGDEAMFRAMGQEDSHGVVTAYFRRTCDYKPFSNKDVLGTV